jgi:hypothetical protein
VIDPANTLGIPLLPLTQDVWLAAWPTCLKDFAAFATATKHDATGNMIGAVLFLSLIPIPAAPWRYFPIYLPAWCSWERWAAATSGRAHPCPTAYRSRGPLSTSSSDGASLNSSRKSRRRVNIANSPSGVRGHSSFGLSQ